MKGTNRLIVVGAGPKAMALVAKRAVLRQLGWSVPELVVLDRFGIGANWSGNFGFTDGEQILGTPPEKDVGFPYDSVVWTNNATGVADNDAVNRLMMEYSWQSYLVHLGLYGDWIDRGRPHPAHKEFHAYLVWVSKRAQFEVIIGQVIRIWISKGQWAVSYDRGGKEFAETGSGLLITGPGEPKRRIPVTPTKHPLVINGQDLWKEMKGLKDKVAFRYGKPTIGVIGSGETAASAIVGLLDMFGDHVVIRSINRQGVLYSRGESYHENRLFTNPKLDRGPGLGWSNLAELQRHEFLRRTDRSVFSLQAQTRINRAANVSPLLGEAESIEVNDDRVYLKLVGIDASEVLDFVIDATGFDAEWFVRLFDAKTARMWARAAGRGSKPRPQCTACGTAFPHRGVPIGSDLSVEKFMPKLHLPMQAALDQGPGFPNLSCLGRLSDAVLSSYAVPNVLP